jgi:hypothetical protein
MSCVNVILEHFDYHRTSFLSCSLASLRASLQKINERFTPNMSRFDMISVFFETTYGSLVASTLRKSLWPALDSFSISERSGMENMPWLTSDLTPWMTRLPRKMPIGRLKSCLQSMHPSTQAMFKPSSKQSCWNAILRHLKQRGRFLLSQDDDYLIEQFLSTRPSTSMTEKKTRTSPMTKIASL